MSRQLVWVILGILCISIVVYSYHQYRVSWAPLEPFTTVSAPPEQSLEAAVWTPAPLKRVGSLEGSLRSCAVYYTSNVDICDRPVYNSTEPLDTLVNQDAINYYALGKDTVNGQITRLESDTNRDAQKNNALANLKRVLADIDSFPFKNTCKLDMSNLKEATQHPYKINTAYEGEARRGNPEHWSYCYYRTAADTTPGATDRISTETRASIPFTRVFQDTRATYASESAGTLQRYDMRSMYNDDLLNLHCMLYSSSLEAGGSVSAFHNTKFMECTLDVSDVASTNTKTLRIRRLRPVVIFNGTLITEPSAVETKKAYLRFIDIVRSQSALVHRQKAYPLTVYKLLFHLCNAASSPIVPGSGTTGTTNETTLAYNKYIQLAIPKPIRGTGSSADKQLLTLKPSYASTELQIYDFYAQPPGGDISDMSFDIADLDTKI